MSKIYVVTFSNYHGEREIITACHSKDEARQVISDDAKENLPRSLLWGCKGNIIMVINWQERYEMFFDDEFYEILEF